MEKFCFLTDRHELAKAINFNKYPVLTMNIGKPVRGWEDVYEGCKVRIRCNFDHSYYHQCTLEMFGDEQKEIYHDMPQCYNKLHLTSKCACIHSDFGLSDVEEMVEYAQAPIVEPGQEVIVFFQDAERRVGYVRKMKVSDRVSDLTYPAATINTIEEE